MAAATLCTCKHLMKRQTNLFRNGSHLWRQFSSISPPEAVNVPEQDTETVPKKKIVIPKYIPRGPTDILKALASTVQLDPTAPQYKYYDDPYLIPSSHVAKRSYALSKEAGQKAAKYFIEKYPDQFANNPSQPSVKSFLKTEEVTEETEVSEDDLSCFINCDEVANAIQTYKNLMAKGVELDKEVVQELLELVCFFNSENEPLEDNLEEKWFSQASRAKNTWKKGHFADELFESLEPQTPRAYNSYLLGLLEHNAISQAQELYLEMKKNNIGVLRDAYHGLISNAYYIQDGSETRWQMVVDLLTEMQENKIRPNVNTFNAALEVLTHAGRWPDAQPNALKIIGEMNHLNIKACLATYYFLLVIFYKEKAALPSPIIYSIMDEVEGKKWEFKHPKDTYFFPTIMELNNTIFHDNKLGHRIHSTYIDGNTQMINYAKNESIYFQHFFRLLIATEDLDQFFQIYNIYVPNTYTPEPSVFLDLINRINLSSSHHYLPQIWNDVCMFGYAHVSRIVSPLLEVLAQDIVAPKDQEKMLQLGWDIKEKVEQIQRDSATNNKTPFYFTCSELSDLLQVAAISKDVPKCQEILNLIFKESHTADTLKESAFLTYCPLVLNNNLPKELLMTLNFLFNNTHMPNLWIKLKEILPQSPFSPEERSQVEYLCRGSESVA